MIAFLDGVSLLEEYLFKVTFYSGLNLNAISGVYPPNEIASLRDLLPLRIYCADWRCFLLCVSGKSTQPQQHRNCTDTGTQPRKSVSSAATQHKTYFPDRIAILSTGLSYRADPAHQR